MMTIRCDVIAWLRCLRGLLSHPPSDLASVRFCLHVVVGEPCVKFPSFARRPSNLLNKRNTRIPLSKLNTSSVPTIMCATLE